MSDDKSWWGKTKTLVVGSGVMPEHATVKVELGMDNGDSTRTALEFSWGAGPSPVVTTKPPVHGGDPGEISSVRIGLAGAWEREGMARAMILAGMELLKGTDP